MGGSMSLLWQTLTILSTGRNDAPPPRRVRRLPSRRLFRPVAPFEISGTLHSINGSTLTFTNRNGKERLIDASAAIGKAKLLWL